jgi:thiol-disulfide isomerase/thioredoxin
VINMWASWCEPCRSELPVLQSLADRANGRLHVVGVDTGDSRDAAASFGTARNVTMPTLYDRDKQLLGALGRINLPITIFVDSAGRDYVHLRPVGPDDLARLVREHTGVAVTS